MRHPVREGRIFCIHGQNPAVNFCQPYEDQGGAKEAAGALPGRAVGTLRRRGVSIDYALRRVTVAGTPVELTATEYAVLYELTVYAPAR